MSCLESNNENSNNLNTQDSNRNSQYRNSFSDRRSSTNQLQIPTSFCVMKTVETVNENSTIFYGKRDSITRSKVLEKENVQSNNKSKASKSQIIDSSANKQDSSVKSINISLKKPKALA